MTTAERDILSVSEGVVVHQVNCFGIMGAGLAAQIRKNEPKVFRAYEKLCASAMDNSYTLLGQIQVVPVDKRLWYVNAFGQYDMGGTRATEYGSFTMCMSNLKDWVQKTGHELWKSAGGSGKIPVYLPYKIGCGLGGGDWSIIKDIISKYLPDAVICRLKN